MRLLFMRQKRLDSGMNMLRFVLGRKLRLNVAGVWILLKKRYEVYRMYSKGCCRLRNMMMIWLGNEVREDISFTT